MNICRITGRVRNAAIALTGAWVGAELLANAQTNTPATAEETKPAAEFKPIGPGEYNNWLEFSIGNFFVSGDQAQFQQRHQWSAGLFGGVEDFHWETPVEKKGIFTIDGRGIFDNHDYALTLSVSHPDKGY